MAKESVMLKSIRKDCYAIGLNFDNIYTKTDILLKIYRKVSWSMNERFDDLNEITYESCLGDMGNLIYLLNFAPDKELDTFKNRALCAMQTRALVTLIEKAAVKIRDYPENGRVYYSIIELTYLNYFKYSESEILEQLDLERSTYFRKKKEATMLLGMFSLDLCCRNRYKCLKRRATDLRLNCD